LSDVPEGLPNGARPDPDNEGWFSWGDFPRGSFAAQTGRLLFRPDGHGRAMTRMFPDEAHQNCAGMAEGHYVTLDCHTRFVARGRIGVPLDAHVHLLKQTAGGLVFFEGHCEQEGEICYAFTGTLKRITARGPNGPSR
jgi:hypothetical protein